MKYEKKYQLSSWNDWDHMVANSIDDFFQSFSLYPTILLANSFTYSQIDFITTINPEKKKNIHKILENDSDQNSNSMTFNEKENVGLASFRKGTCELDFAVDQELKDREFSLVYDDEPDWGDADDPIPVMEDDITVNKAVLQR